MHTHGLSSAELLMIVKAINTRPAGITKKATLDNVATFDRGYVVASLDQLPVKLHELRMKEMLIAKLSYMPSDETIRRRCPHPRTQSLPNGRLLCIDCQQEID